MPLIFKILLTFLFSSSLATAEAIKQAKPWLGIGIEKGPKGVLIKTVLKDTPAQRAGFLPGDEIIQIDGKAMTRPEQLIDAVQSKGVGYVVKIEYVRAGKSLQQSLALELQPDALAMMQKLYVDKPAPAFEVRTVAANKPMTLAQHKGKVVLLEFWATWRPACRSAVPFLNELAKKNKELVILGVSDEEEAKLKSFQQQHQVGYTLVRDHEQKVSADYQVSSIPSFFLIDKQGVVRQVVMGAGSYLEALAGDITKLQSAP